MNDSRITLLGCGILKKEIEWLIKKNNWPLDTVFLDSSLHVDFNKLSNCLTTALDKYRDRNTIVFYGCCHPHMEGILKDANTFRTAGQNCVDILLGNELFTEELSKGAFFLLEEWVHRWNYIVTRTFGNNLEITRNIFQGDRKYLLGIKTPCSTDFEAEAVDASIMIGLPLRWMEVSLDNLESVLNTTITDKLRELQ